MAFRKRWCSEIVTSSEGYSVRFFSRGLLLYQEAGVRVFVSTEMLATEKSWALYPAVMRLDDPRGTNLTDEKLRILIIERIKAVFQFLDLNLSIYGR